MVTLRGVTLLEKKKKKKKGKMLRVIVGLLNLVPCSSDLELGLLSARSGDLDTANIQFEKSLAANENGGKAKAGALHSIGNILLMRGDVNGAIEHHRLAKLEDSKSIPPLASVCNGYERSCGVLADLFWVSSVAKQQLYQLAIAASEDGIANITRLNPSEVYQSHISLAMQLEASGLMDEAAAHIQMAVGIQPHNLALVVHRALMVCLSRLVYHALFIIPLFVRGSSNVQSNVQIPAIYNSLAHLQQSRREFICYLIVG